MTDYTTSLLYYGLAKSTRKTYSASQRRFLEFCYWAGHIHENGSPLPANEQTLMMFAAHLSQTIKASSIKVYLSGVRSLHIEQGFKNPLDNCFRLERVLRGIKRRQGAGTRQRLPITIAILRKLYSILNLNDYTDALFWAACLTGFFGFLRCGEFTTKSSHFDINTSLSLADLQVDKHLNPSVMLLNIKASKTDQFRCGHTLRIGASGSNICAVRALMNYLHHRGGNPGPLFMLQNGQPLSRSKFCSWLTEAMTRIGETGQYSGHSFRIGAATTAAAVGIPDHLIKTLGRWISDAYQIYIRTPPEVLACVASRMVV